MGFPGGSEVKNPPANAGGIGDVGLIPGSGRSPRGGNGNPLQYSCLENSMDRGAWWAAVHRVAKSETRRDTATKQQQQSQENLARKWRRGKGKEIRPT